MDACGSFSGKVIGMAIIRAVRSALDRAGHWIGETYCDVSQRVAERLEGVSDSIAEQRYRASRQVEQARNTHVPPQQVIDIKDYHVMNGHSHLN